MKQALLVMAGAVPGAVLRYFAGMVLNPALESGKYPWGTFVVNCLGCLLIGFFLGMREKHGLSESAGLLLVTGFLGAFTTFSGFSAELLYMFKNNFFSTALVYIIASNVLGILLAAGTYKWIVS